MKSHSVFWCSAMAELISNFETVVSVNVELSLNLVFEHLN